MIWVIWVIWVSLKHPILYVTAFQFYDMWFLEGFFLEGGVRWILPMTYVCCTKGTIFIIPHQWMVGFRGVLPSRNHSGSFTQLYRYVWDGLYRLGPVSQMIVFRDTKQEGGRCVDNQSISVGWVACRWSWRYRLRQKNSVFTLQEFQVSL